ncbi:diguanylate cyclase (GGDEF)-like protein/PAS domain S-box-containing protein [Halomonas fontilapidosi]|uniref:Diguanylate cyclase (GGDEF)-like protein/PAS domain S-box-containing protein n=1 Tax=Halomonas fontilapidosi TaxID=616675 RepID=A0A7W5GY28_9GAMM|nr:GGDEF and EAL domain-containing protein [Halomonas fontilapidosi]MBB3182852.1 diguanylate cyclase (GGDEF)-like protein/PAS domain S-box-containing protein [Halomonas fontilapidosi]
MNTQGVPCPTSAREGQGPHGTVDNTLGRATVELAAGVFSQVSEAMIITDVDHGVLDINPAFTKLTGLTPEALVGESLQAFLLAGAPSTRVDELWRELHFADHCKAEITYRHRNGRTSPAVISATRVRDQQGQTSHLVWVLSDLGALAAARRSGREVYFDALTGLPNLQLLTQLIQESLLHAHHKGGSLAICALDIDHFKRINDQHGQEIGDLMIAAFAQRLSHQLHGDDILARVGGDEFVLLLHQGADDDTLERLLAAMRQPLFIKGRRLQVTASLGVTFFPRDDEDGDVLLRHATQAMYRAKQQGRATYQVFDTGLDREIQAREASRQRFATALPEGELRLHYQPQVDIFGGEVIGAEALVRWQHPEEGLLAPGRFLPIIEGTALEIELGEWVIEAALRQLQAWCMQGISLPVHVNISPAHLLSGEFAERLAGLLTCYPEVPARLLKLEVVESAAIHDIQTALSVMRHCQALEIDFAIDDFGTGYSSLTHLRQLPVDLIKIDQSFVRDMLTDPDDMAIVESVIYMANRFRRPMLAEGVETLDHARALLALGCARVQGYGIARPMPAEDFPAWLRDWPGRHEWSALAMHLQKLTPHARPHQVE